MGHNRKKIIYFEGNKTLLKSIGILFIVMSVLSVILGYTIVNTTWSNHETLALSSLVFCIASASALISLGLWKDKKAIGV
jgi:hypothetical protein